MMELRYAAAAARMATVLSLSACPVFAQAVLDEDSLFAQEELTITDTVAGQLPAAAGKGDAEFLSELFGASEVVLPDDLGAAAEALPLDDVVAEDAVKPEKTEVVPESLDAVVEGVVAEPAADIDQFPLDKGFDADAVLGEMLDMGNSDAVAEVAAGSVTNTPAPVADAAKDKDADLDAMLGEMVAAEPDAVAGDASVVAVAEPVAEAASVVAEVEPVVAEPVAEAASVVAEVEPVVAEPVAEAASVVAEAEPVVAEPVAEATAAKDDLGFLFDDAPAVVEPGPVADVPAVAVAVEEKGVPVTDDFDSLFADAPVAVADPAPVAAVEPAAVPAGGDDLDALIGGLAAEAESVVPVAEAVPAAIPADVPVAEAAPDIPAVAEAVPAAEAAPAELAVAEAEPVEIPAVVPVEEDPMALDDDIFKSLAKSGKKDIRKTPQSVKAPGVAADPFVEALSQPAAPVAESVTAPAEVAAPVAAESVTAPAEADAPFSLDDFVAAESGEKADAAPAEVASVPGRKLPEGAAAFEEAERLKRVAREYHATSALDSAKNALRERDYPRAILMYQQALTHLPRRPDMEPVRAEAHKGLGAAYYLQALSQERMGDLENAKIAAKSAVKFGYVRAEETVARIQSKIDVPTEPAPPPAKHRWREEEYQTTQSQVKEFLKRGREAYLTGEYDRAILAFESVLARDPENKEAIRLMHSAANKQYDRSSMELNANAARMTAMVRDTWNPRHYGLHETPIESKAGGTTVITGDEEARRAAILDKMSKIRIPEVDFRQANIRDVVKFLFEQSVEFDPAPNPADRKGVTIILKLDGDAGGTGAAAPAAPAGGFDFGAPAAEAQGAANETLVTFSALDITLKDALDYSVDIAGLKYLIRGSAVMVMPANEAGGAIEHRMYDVLPSAITRLRELSTAVTSGRGNARMRGSSDFTEITGTGGTGGGEEVDLKEFFQEMGVEWPNKSSIKFVSGLGKLVVANTLENLTVFEKVLSILNVVPYQIEIEARFIDVAQTDVDSLGLEWLLTDNWELAKKSGQEGVPLAAQERIVMNSNDGTGGFTQGNRFLSSAGVGVSGTMMADTVASISGVLSNPELTVILHALQNRGNTDLLSAPKITTQSGQAATIKVVTEYIYPTEFETSGIGGDNNTTTTGNTGGGVVGAVVTPSEFATREVGVILEVTPEVSPEGQMISLALSPEVVSEPTWRNYGSSYTSYDPNGNPVVQQLNMEQPFFHTRKLTTNLLIYNGATVVMGGMITEVRNKVDDKIPLLGDIPLVGRLFRSNYESSEKRNLLIFVTARLVDPSGRALDRERFGVDSSIAAKIVASEQPSN